ncbi:acyltransferase family protein [Rothia sp. L_38]|uniref:acyltransferase family protein n=1 Tax=Rothia sp. L_38 TaxID=3422315 RepID=UPI003D6AA4F3
MYQPRHSTQRISDNKRYGYIDFIRLVCIFFIVIGHVWTEIPLTVFVYVFMILSGYLWKSGRELILEARNKFKILVYPYLGWGIPLLIILVIQLVFFAQIGTSDVLKTVATVLWGGEKAKAPFTAFWYFTAIWFSGIFYRYITQRSAFVYGVSIALSLIAGSFFGEELANLPLGIGVAFCSLVFYAAGHALQVLQTKITVPWYISLLLLGASVYMIATVTVAPMVLKSGDFGTPVLSTLVYSLLALAWIASMEVLYQPLEALLERPVAWFVGLATPVILLHPVPIWFWYNVGWTGKDMADKVPLFIICLIFSVVLALLAKNIVPPWGQKILVP